MTNENAFDLQLFADGGAGSAGGEAGVQGAAEGEISRDANGGTGEEENLDAAEREKAFTKFKADYKAEFDREVQNIVKQRLKRAKDFERQANEYHDKTSGIFESLAVKYGLNADNIDGIVKAVQEDNSYYEDEALKRGMDVSEFRHLKQIERENEIFKSRQEQFQRQQEEEQWYLALAEQAEKTKSVYPSFDISNEAENNPQFVMLIEKGVDVQTAYEITHKDDVIAAAMKYAADSTKSKMQSSIIKNSQRPSENGLTSSGAVKTLTDISKLTPKEMEELKERARRGEKVTLQN